MPQHELSAMINKKKRRLSESREQVEIAQESQPIENAPTSAHTVAPKVVAIKTAPPKTTARVKSSSLVKSAPETVPNKRPYRRGASLGVDDARVLSSRISTTLLNKMTERLAELNGQALSRSEQKISQREFLESAVAQVLAIPDSEWFDL